MISKIKRTFYFRFYNEKLSRTPLNSDDVNIIVREIIGEKNRLVRIYQVTPFGNFLIKSIKKSELNDKIRQNSLYIMPESIKTKKQLETAIIYMIYNCKKKNWLRQ